MPGDTRKSNGRLSCPFFFVRKTVPITRDKALFVRTPLRCKNGRVRIPECRAPGLRILFFFSRGCGSMFDFTTLLYLLVMAILCSFLFCFWLLIIWVGLVHCYMYMMEWRADRHLAKTADSKSKNYFDKIEEFRNELE